MGIDNTTFEIILIGFAISLGLNLYWAMKDIVGHYFDGSGGNKKRLVPRNDSQ